MAKTIPSDSAPNDVRYTCIIRQVAPYGIHVDIPDLKAKGLLRVTELFNPEMVQDRTCVGTEIVARILGKETPDGPFILSQP
jgi:hypothetical protein